MAAESSRSGPSADSYIGSLISLTSKSEIRYEGILYNINIEESSIGLRNVRSFGTEGRKKDGPQIPASDKVYEYIIFRGSDIKDLQVKSPPPVQTAHIHSDPAIIQSHYSRPATASTTTSLPSVGSGVVPDPSSHATQKEHPRSTFQGSLPPGGSLASWGSSPPLPNPDGSGLAMPMYWQGYYAPSSGLPHLQQPPLLRPPPGLPIPPSMQQQLQYSGINASLPSGSPSLPEFPPPLLPPGSSALSLTSSMSPPTLAPAHASALAPETSASLMPSKPPITSPPAASPAAALASNLPFVTPSTFESVPTLSRNMSSIIGSKMRTVPSPSVTLQTISQAMSSIIGSSSSSQVESSLLLVTPGQLSQPGPSMSAFSEPSQMSNKDVEVNPPKAKVKPLIAEPTALSPAESKEPILPLPKSTEQKPNGAALQTYHSSRGRGRGRGRGNRYPRPVTKFTEEFDFTAMNEKFKKDEVWGHLGKNKAQLKDGEGEDEADDTLEDNAPECIKLEIKPVYSKDEFFDSLSSNSLDHGTRIGRTKFSEQLKIDTETFGDFPRHRPSPGGGRGHRGGRTRGSYYGRGYGYAGRGRGHTVLNRTS